MRYDRTIAHGLGRLRKNVSATIGRDAEWDGTPAAGFFEFLNRFVNAGNDNDVSEGRDLYLLPEFTKGDLKRELYTIMPSLQGGRSGEVSSYMELVHWLPRKYADEQLLSSQDALFHGISQEDGETENDLFARLWGVRRLCRYVHTKGQIVAVRWFRGWKGRGPSAVDSTPPGASPHHPDPGQQGNDLSESQGDRIWTGSGFFPCVFPNPATTCLSFSLWRDLSVWRIWGGHFGRWRSGL